MEKILVTGGAGFIGSNFIFYMLRKHNDTQIVCYDNLTYAGCLRSLRSIILSKDPNFRFVKGDITDAESVGRLMRTEQFDIVVNFAAQSHVDRAIKEPADFQTTNYVGTQVLLDAFNQYGISRFHQVSTDEVYGSIPLDSDEAFTEDAPLKPGNPYAASKAAADMLCMSYYNTYGTPVTISRSCNNYGPRQFPEKLVPKIITSALHNEKVPLYGDAQNVRTWLFVEDHCRAIDRIIHDGKIGNIYNVDGTDDYANINLAQDILQRMGKDPDEYIEFVEDRAGHDRRYSIDDTKLYDELGWEPEKDMDHGLNRTIDWYTRHTWWETIFDGTYKDTETELLKLV